MAAVGGTDLCAGDSNARQLYQEENNNQTDDVAKAFAMGCTIGVRADVCEGAPEDEGSERGDGGYSDEFEDEKTDAEDAEQLSYPAVARSQTHQEVTRPRALDPRETRSLTGSRMLSSVPPPGGASRRRNMSFSNDRLREIDRHNHILLNKIVSARKAVVGARREEPARARPAPAAAILRKKQQRQIDHDNLILLKKIQRAKSSSCSLRR